MVLLSIQEKIIKDKSFEKEDSNFIKMVKQKMEDQKQ